MKNKRQIILLGLVALIIIGTIFGILLCKNRSNDEVISEEVSDDKELLADPEEIMKSQAQLLEGIRHFELEYASHYNLEYLPNDLKNYDRVMKKYLTPVLTTVKDFNYDFPIEERHKGTVSVSVKYQSFNLKDDDKVWVYATYLDNYICDKVIFVYDELNVTEDSINIRTHFETIKNIPSSALESRLIVLSVIPAEQ